MLHCGLYLLRYYQTVTFSNPCIAASVQELIYVATHIRKQRQERNRQPVSGRLYTSPGRSSYGPAVLQLEKIRVNVTRADEDAAARCVTDATKTHFPRFTFAPLHLRPPPLACVSPVEARPRKSREVFLFTARRHVKVRHVKVLLLMALPNGDSRRRPRQTTSGAERNSHPPRRSYTPFGTTFRGGGLLRRSRGDISE